MDKKRLKEIEEDINQWNDMSWDFSVAKELIQTVKYQQNKIEEIIEELKKEKDMAFEFCNFGISNTLEYYIEKLENVMEEND